MDCEQFTTYLNPPPKNKSCGLCDGFAQCRLPNRRNGNDNGRKVYSGKTIDTESIEHYENGAAYRRAPYDQSGSGDH